MYYGFGKEWGKQACSLPQTGFRGYFTGPQRGISDHTGRTIEDVQFYEKILEKLLQEGLLTRSPSAIISLPE